MRHVRRDRTTRWEGAKPGPSSRLDTGAYKRQESPHAFRRGQRTRSLSCPHHNSWELEGASWGLRKTWQGGAPGAMQSTWTPDTHVSAREPGIQHQPLLHAISRTLERLGIPHRVESGEPFTADRNLPKEQGEGGSQTRTDGVEMEPGRRLGFKSRGWRSMQ